MSRALGFGLDLVVVVAFVAIGRSTHDESNAVVGLTLTAAPFLIALLVGWLVSGVAKRDPTTVVIGIGIWACTWILGLALRGLVFHEGTAAPFVVVAGLTLAFGLIGWRLVAQLITRRRSA